MEAPVDAPVEAPAIPVTAPEPLVEEEAVDPSPAVAPDEAPAAAVRSALLRLAKLTETAAADDTLVDLPLRRRLEMLRQL